MASHKKREYEGKDIADAISKACKSLNVSQEDLDIEVLTTGTSGIFGLCRQKCRLRVAVKGEDSQKAEKKPPKRPVKSKSEKEKTFAKKKRPSLKEKKKEDMPEPSAKTQDKTGNPKKIFSWARICLRRSRLT